MDLSFRVIIWFYLRLMQRFPADLFFSIFQEFIETKSLTPTPLLSITYAHSWGKFTISISWTKTKRKPRHSIFDLFHRRSIFWRDDCEANGTVDHRRQPDLTNMLHEVTPPITILSFNVCSMSSSIVGLFVILDDLLVVQTSNFQVIDSRASHRSYDSSPLTLVPMFDIDESLFITNHSLLKKSVSIRFWQ